MGSSGPTIGPRLSRSVIAIRGITLNLVAILGWTPRIFIEKMPLKISMDDYAFLVINSLLGDQPLPVFMSTLSQMVATQEAESFTVYQPSRFSGQKKWGSEFP